MRARIMLVALVIPLLGGCAYWRDRGRDALDVVTLGFGPGLGAKARVGPVQVGALAMMQIVGVRDGSAGLYRTGGVDGPQAWEGQKVILGFEESAPPGNGPARGKVFDLGNFVVPMPPPGERIPASYWTQIEVTGAAVLGFKVGFNPGELLDLLLGWFGVDIYRDDVGDRRDEDELR